MNPIIPTDPVVGEPDTGAATTQASNLGALGIMLIAVALQVTGAVLLKAIADRQDSWSLAVLALGLAAVGVVDVARLVVWGLAHRRFPLSTTFPLSSLFFPAMLGVAILYGDEVGMLQVAGAALITGGVAWLTLRAPT
jgi:multidrug transporter EmrE-like cation transporter